MYIWLLISSSSIPNMDMLDHIQSWSYPIIPSQRDNMCHVPKIKVSEAVSRHSKIVLFVNDNPGILTHRGFERGKPAGIWGELQWSWREGGHLYIMGPGVDSAVCFKRKGWPFGGSAISLKSSGNSIGFSMYDLWKLLNGHNFSTEKLGKGAEDSEIFHDT